MANDSTGKTVLIYQAFGIPEAFDQVTFSLLTLYHVQKGDFSKLHPVIYTDNAAKFEKYFKGLPFTFVEISEVKMAQYKGPRNYFHRMRHCLIKDCFEEFKSNIIYVDGDTFFMDSPEKIASQVNTSNSLMHKREFTLVDGGDFEGNIWLELRKLVRSNTFIRRGEKYKIPFSFEMWNAGVLGISFDNRHLIEDVIELIDQILPVSKIHTAEQLGVGYILQSKTTILPSDHIIYHYWPADLKTAYNYFIRSFLSKIDTVSVAEFAAKAYEASKLKENMPRVEATYWDRLKLRLSLVKKVALKGSL